MKAKTIALRGQGYRCRRETIRGQGYFGGDGIRCFRVRQPDGSLAMPIATHQSAAKAWAQVHRVLGGSPTFGDVFAAELGG